MHVQVVGDARAGGGAEVEADVVALRSECRLDRLEGAVEQLPELAALLGFEIARRRDVAGRHDHQVPAAERVEVEHDVGALAAMDDQRVLVAQLQVVAEDAALGALTRDVAQPPGCPEPLHSQRLHAGNAHGAGLLGRPRGWGGVAALAAA